MIYFDLPAHLRILFSGQDARHGFVIVCLGHERPHRGAVSQNDIRQPVNRRVECVEQNLLGHHSYNGVEQIALRAADKIRQQILVKHLVRGAELAEIDIADYVRSVERGDDIHHAVEARIELRIAVEQAVCDSAAEAYRHDIYLVVTRLALYLTDEIIEFIGYLAVVAERIIGEIIEMVFARNFREAVYRHVAIYLFFVFVGTFCNALRIFLDSDIIDILAVRVKSVDIERALERLSERLDKAVVALGDEHLDERPEQIFYDIFSIGVYRPAGYLLAVLIDRYLVVLIEISLGLTDAVDNDRRAVFTGSAAFGQSAGLFRLCGLCFFARFSERRSESRFVGGRHGFMLCAAVRCGGYAGRENKSRAEYQRRYSPD